MLDISFYKNKVVLITGHTGFKGTWLSKILINAGAKVIGYALAPLRAPNLFKLADIEKDMVSIIGDIRDYKKLKNVFDFYKPSCVFHLAAQPLVIESYNNPLYTYETNVMGTANVLECVRLTSSVKSFLNVTTDKVYLNNEEYDHAFKEDEPLDGYDPYSNSKSCSELITHSYKKSFFNESGCAISTARAGNVLGGGDFSENRIIPDCVRSIEKKEIIKVRNQYSTRPYQHVLEPLYVYLEIVEKQYNDKKYEGYYNVGPDDCDVINTGSLVSLFCSSYGNDLKWINVNTNEHHEASFLKLDNNKIKNVFNYAPRWHIEKCIDKVVEWTNIYISDKNNIPIIMNEQISEFFEEKI